MTVEWKALGDICSLGVGQAPNDNELGEYPFINAGTTPSGYITAYNTEPETITTPSRGQGGVGFVGYQDKSFWCGPLCYKIRSTNRNVSTRYIYHFMSNSTTDIVSLANMTGVPALNRKELVGFLIPIPCPDNPGKSLQIQAEIVRILDTFTELTAELTARKKQYSYYRDKLLNFESADFADSRRLGKDGEARLSDRQVEWRNFSDVGVILRGTAITEKQTKPGKYPVVANGPSHNYYHDQSNRNGETIVIARSGAYAGLVSYWDIPIFLTDAFSIHPDKNVLNTKYVYYLFKNNQNKIHEMSKGAGVPHVRASDFESYKIPIPFPNDLKKSLAEQARIVSILDKFDALTTSITEGLPREIELRKKQYEYYRNLLLSFPGSEVQSP